MPKRMIDGEAMWSSNKIAHCSSQIPASSGVYYAWFYALADANGVFDLTSVHVVHSRISMQLPFLKVEHTEQILNDFYHNGLLFIWWEKGKKLGYWTNSDQRGRNPSQLERKKYKNLSEGIPTEECQKYLDSYIASLGEFGDNLAKRQPSSQSRLDSESISSVSRPDREISDFSVNLTPSRVDRERIASRLTHDTLPIESAQNRIELNRIEESGIGLKENILSVEILGGQKLQEQLQTPAAQTAADIYPPEEKIPTPRNTSARSKRLVDEATTQRELSAGAGPDLVRHPIGFKQPMSPLELAAAIRSEILPQKQPEIVQEKPLENKAQIAIENQAQNSTGNQPAPAVAVDAKPPTGNLAQIIDTETRVCQDCHHSFSLREFFSHPCVAQNDRLKAKYDF